MKLTASLAAALGALTIISPLVTASQTAEARGLSIADAELEPRAAADCPLTTRKHHHRGKKNKKAKQVKAKINSLAESGRHRHGHKTSSARPSYYWSGSKGMSKSTTSKPESYAPVSSVPAGSTGSTGSTGSSGSTTSSSGSSSMSGFEQTVLSMHNADRAKHSAGALTWDATLASAAAKWAAGCKWQHTPNNPYGQNIAAGTGTGFGAKESCTMWYDEISQYNFGQGSYSDVTGHFTQMVWKSTKKLGCAIQQCSASQMGLGSQGTAQFVVCNYDPPGNYIGQFVQNVLSS